VGTGEVERGKGKGKGGGTAAPLYFT